MGSLPLNAKPPIQTTPWKDVEHKSRLGRLFSGFSQVLRDMIDHGPELV